MKKAIWRSHPVAAELLLCVLLAIVGLAQFATSFKLLPILIGAAVVVLLAVRNLRTLYHPVALLLIGYVVLAGLSGIWAIAGKFFLREFSKIFVAGGLFLMVLLAKKFEAHTVRRLLSGMALIGAVYSFLSVEYVTTGLSKVVIEALIPDMAAVVVAVEDGIRMTGIFGTPNSMATILALSIFFAISLVCSEENGKKRMYYAGMLALNAYAFLMMFSMGGTAFFAVSILVYLLADGKRRTVSFVHMLTGAAPTLLWVFVSFPFLSADGAVKFLPLLAMAANVATVIALEHFLAPKLVGMLEKRAKLAAGVVVGLILLAVVYVVAGMNVSSAYTFGDSIRRSVYPEPGTHTLTIQATDEVSYKIVSQDEADTMMHTETTLASGTGAEVTFEVPEGSQVCYITLWGKSGTVVEEALLDGETAVKLEYPLLPAFIANRLQGLWANQNVIQRTVFFEDGMKLFLQHPLLGCGVGAFETGVTSVQEFYYETRYIHNHYIQVLMECGILGGVLFVAGLVGLLVLLWKKRKEDEWAFRGEYAALCAALVMTITHIGFETSLSHNVFLWFFFVLAGCIIRCCVAEKVPEAVPYTKRKAPVKKTSPVLRCGCMILPAVFVVSILCNVVGKQYLNRPAYTEESLMSNLSTAAKIDPYEKNDAKLSYLLASLQYGSGQYYGQANEYAQQLQSVQSNSIPVQLAYYYLQTGQWEQAVNAAKAGAAYSASSAANWNATVEQFYLVLMDVTRTPFFGQAETVAPLVMEYYELLQERNAASMEHIELTALSKDFFGKMKAITECDGSQTAVSSILTQQVFDSETACDADLDGIADQITSHQGVDFGTKGTMTMQPDGQITLSLFYGQLPTGAFQVKVQCNDPEAIRLWSAKTKSDIPAQVEDGWAVFEVPLSDLENSELTVCVSSAAGQEIAKVEVLAPTAG